MLTLLGKHPVRERKPTCLELAFGQVLEELGDHTRLLLTIFGICMTAEIEDDFQKLVKFNLTRLVLVDSLNQILDFLDRVDKTKANQGDLQLVNADRTTAIIVQTIEAIL